jgi:hypothetical protein
MTITVKHEAVNTTRANRNKFGVLGDKRRSVFAYQGAGYIYSANRRDGVFSETQLVWDAS